MIGAGFITEPQTETGRPSVVILDNDHSSTAITTGAYTELLASTYAEINHLEIFDSSGETLVLAIGESGSEIDLIEITPGGNGDIPLKITAGSRISVKAKTEDTSSGRLSINCLG